MGFWSHLLFHDWFRPPSRGDTRMSPLPMRQARYERVFIDPPPQPGWRATAFGEFHAGTGRFIDSHGKAGTYEISTLRLIDSEGVVMTRMEFDLMPKLQRRTTYIKVGEDLV